MTFKLALFDFDGTLADSFPFFISVFNQLAQEHRFKSIAMHEIEALRGHDARRMMKHVGLPWWKFPMVSKDFIKMMNQNTHNIALFEGVADALAYLAKHSISLSIVSSNSRANVSQILGNQCVELFSSIECGASVFGKATRLRRVLKHMNIRPQDAIYIGDQATDIEAARASKIAFGAVAWGYATIGSLRAHHPDMEFHSPLDLNKLALPTKQQDDE